MAEPGLWSSSDTILCREKHQGPKPPTLTFRNASWQKLGLSVSAEPEGSGRWHIQGMCFCILLFGVPDLIISSRKFWVLHVYSEETRSSASLCLSKWQTFVLQTCVFCLTVHTVAEQEGALFSSLGLCSVSLPLSFFPLRRGPESWAGFGQDKKQLSHFA